MANGRTHLKAGITTGVATALYTARDLTGWAFVTEVVGGGAGGAVGGLLPDLIEPAIHSWHRSTAHSLTTATALGSTALRCIPDLQLKCRANAAHHDALSEAAADAVSKAWHAFMSFLWRFLGGFLAGLPAGRPPILPPFEGGCHRELQDVLGR
jgi:hypothetical protein